MPAWFRADADPVIGRVVRLMQNEPAEPWTVGDAGRHGRRLAGAARPAVPRGRRRTTDYVPHLWRLALAADLLTAGDATVGAIAREVGYGSPFTFSTAFKRTYGASPRRTATGNSPPCPRKLIAR